MHHDHSHLRTYLAFFFVSTFLIGGLVYLFAPFSPGLLTSSTLTNNPAQTPPIDTTYLPEPVVPSADNTPLNDQDDAERTAKRIRFTRLLLKYQKDLQSLQDEKMNSLGSVDPELDTKIESLMKRIDNLEGIIANLSQ